MTLATPAFDSVLLISFGGPAGLDDIRPFLRNVLRGRKIPAERIEAVAKHYELFSGVSPLTAITERQANRLRSQLKEHGPDVPVFVGMRNWHPFLEDTLEKMARNGLSRALGIILAAQHSYSSCGQYRQNVADARSSLRATHGLDVELIYADGWHTHPGFIRANAEHIAAAQNLLPVHVRSKATIIFTAHSIPREMADVCRYEEELNESAHAVANVLGTKRWSLVFQSRSGRPAVPWLEPDICDYLHSSRSELDAAIISPIGFVADHVEVMYDLDKEAADICRDLSIPMQRAAAVNDHHSFIDTLAAITRRAYKHKCPLPIVPKHPPKQQEGPPIAR